jgi:hypothetical protein
MIQFLPHRERSALIVVRIIPNTGMLCGQNAVMLVLNLAVRIVTPRLERLKVSSGHSIFQVNSTS